MSEAATKHAGGRPSSYTDDIATQICERVVKGETLKSICEDEGFPSYVTVWRWENERAEFRKSLRRAREAGMFYLVDECIDISDDSSRDVKVVEGRNGELREEPNTEFMARSRLRIETRMRIAGKLNKKVFGDKVALVGGDDEEDAPIKFRKIVTELIDTADRDK